MSPAAFEAMSRSRSLPDEKAATRNIVVEIVVDGGSFLISARDIRNASGAPILVTEASRRSKEAAAAGALRLKGGVTALEFAFKV